MNTTLRETPWTAETLDAPASLSSSMPLTSPRQNVALVEGSAPHLTEETQDLLRNRQGPIRPDLATLLEDVRTRGDRQHPFWARVEGG